MAFNTYWSIVDSIRALPDGREHMWKKKQRGVDRVVTAERMPSGHVFVYFIDRYRDEEGDQEFKKAEHAATAIEEFLVRGMPR